MIHLGTYFGTRAEFDRLGIEEKLGNGSKSSIDTFENWEAAVLNWAQQEAINLVGGVVSFEYFILL